MTRLREVDSSMVSMRSTEMLNRELDMLQRSGDLLPQQAGSPEQLEGALRIVHSRNQAALEYRGLIEPLAPEMPKFRARFVVRVFDLLLVIPALILLLPVMACVALLVSVSSPGPVFFRSRRITRSGEFFDMFKFRTMVTNGDEVLDDYFDRHPAAREIFVRDMKLRTDPRLTSAGRFLRKWSLDELPQLVNVLRGHMSIVGPRPLLVEEFVRFGGAVDTVVRVKGGLTGLWQVAGRNLLTFEERVPLDVRYARTRTILGDMKIILRTVGQLMKGSPGAF